MSQGPVLVECECITSTTMGIDFFEAGRRYTIDMVEAKRHDIWRRFRPLREVSEKEVDEMLKAELEKKAKKRADRDRENAEAAREMERPPKRSTRGKTISTSAPKAGAGKK